MTCPKWGGISAISTCEIGRCFQYTKPPTVAVKVTVLWERHIPKDLTHTSLTVTAYHSFTALQCKQDTTRGENHLSCNRMIVAPACHSAEEKYCRIQWVQHETKWTTAIEGQHCKLNWHGDVLAKWPWIFLIKMIIFSASKPLLLFLSSMSLEASGLMVGGLAQRVL